MPRSRTGRPVVGDRQDRDRGRRRQGQAFEDGRRDPCARRAVVGEDDLVRVSEDRATSTAHGSVVHDLRRNRAEEHRLDRPVAAASRPRSDPPAKSRASSEDQAGRAAAEQEPLDPGIGMGQAEVALRVGEGDGVGADARVPIAVLLWHVRGLGRPGLAAMSAPRGTTLTIRTVEPAGHGMAATRSRATFGRPGPIGRKQDLHDEASFGRPHRRACPAPGHVTKGPIPRTGRPLDVPARRASGPAGQHPAAVPRRPPGRAAGPSPQRRAPPAAGAGPSTRGARTSSPVRLLSRVRHEFLRGIAAAHDGCGAVAELLEPGCGGGRDGERLAGAPGPCSPGAAPSPRCRSLG